jgi:ribose transport system ATP-binding protein
MFSGEEMDMGNEGGSEILSICNISKSFPGVKALNNVSIEVRRGVVHGIVGENGAGKSTLMKILSGVYRKDSGEIYFDDEKIENITPFQTLHRGLSIIYQEFNLVNTMSVGENIFLGRFREMGGMKGTHEAAGKLLDSLGSRINTLTMVSELSAAEKQMVEISKALAFNSKLIIMDEPSSSLTAEEIKKLKEIIFDMRHRGISIIYISHKLDEIFEFCDTVTIMRDGNVIDTKSIGDITRNDMIAKMIGRSIDREFPERPHCVGEPLMTVRSINTKKLHDISFTLNKGEILGLVGLVGSGRTEIIRAIFGADRVKDCEIYINGVKKQIRSPKDAIRAGVALVPEDRKTQGLVLPFSVESNISMASLDRLSRSGFLNRIKERELALRQIKLLNIKTPSAATRVVSLSGGNQQKCIVGRWLETDSIILILDEPTRGIDAGAKYEIYLLMKEIAENGGSVLMISSELPEVLNMSNRVLTICDGRITGEFDPEKVSPEVIVDKAMG